MTTKAGSGRDRLVPWTARLGLAALSALFMALAPGRAHADPGPDDEALFELGGGIDFTVLGSYDVAQGLGDPAERNDLGPGTLGVVLTGDVRIAPAIRLGAEAGIAIGGLVRTEERYFGSSSTVGSTATVWIRSKLGWTAIHRPGMGLRIGGGLGLERMSEATGAGSVQLDSIVAGPWAALLIGRGLIAELHGDLHAPYRGQIGDRSDNPDGVFLAAGVRLSYVFGFGRR